MATLPADSPTATHHAATALMTPEEVVIELGMTQDVQQKPVSSINLPNCRTSFACVSMN